VVDGRKNVHLIYLYSCCDTRGEGGRIDRSLLFDLNRLFED
jgi:hypothetical protein